MLTTPSEFFSNPRKTHPRTVVRAVLLGTALVAGGMSQAMAYCYTILGQNSQILYRSNVPPVDTSFQFHQTVPLVFPRGSSMVFGASEDDCGEVAYNPGVALNQGAANSRVRRSDRS